MFNLLTYIGNGNPVPYYHQIASSIQIIQGGATVGDVTDIQSWNDENFLQIQETAGTPALELLVNFENVESIRRIVIVPLYDGDDNHNFVAELRDYDAANYKRLTQIKHSLDRLHFFIDLPVDDDPYIDENKNAQVRLCHVTSGNVAHDFKLFYIALVR